jgi:hypothetical protein
MLRHVLDGLFWTRIVVTTVAFTTALPSYDLAGGAFETFREVDEFGSHFEGVRELFEEVAASAD